MDSSDELEMRRRESLRRNAEFLGENIDDGIDTDTIVAAVCETRRGH